MVCFHLSCHLRPFVRQRLQRAIIIHTKSCDKSNGEALPSLSQVNHCIDMFYRMCFIWCSSLDFPPKRSHHIKIQRLAPYKTYIIDIYIIEITELVPPKNDGFTAGLASALSKLPLPSTCVPWRRDGSGQVGHGMAWHRCRKGFGFV